jgi:hypothetical protein
MVSEFIWQKLRKIMKSFSRRRRFLSEIPFLLSVLLENTRESGLLRRLYLLPRISQVGNQTLAVQFTDRHFTDRHFVSLFECQSGRSRSRHIQRTEDSGPRNSSSTLTLETGVRTSGRASVLYFSGTCTPALGTRRGHVLKLSDLSPPPGQECFTLLSLRQHIPGVVLTRRYIDMI